MSGPVAVDRAGRPRRRRRASSVAHALRERAGPSRDPLRTAQQRRAQLPQRLGRDPPARRSGRARGGPAGAPRWRRASAARPPRRRRPAASAAPGSGGRPAPRRRRRPRRPCRRPCANETSCLACPGAAKASTSRSSGSGPSSLDGAHVGLGHGQHVAPQALGAVAEDLTRRWRRAASGRSRGARRGACTHTCRPGFSRTSAPAAPPWSRCTCVSSTCRRSPTSTPCAARPARSEARCAPAPQSTSVGSPSGSR